MSKFTKIKRSFFAVSFVGIFGLIKKTNMQAFTTRNTNPCLPFFIRAIPSNPLISRLMHHIPFSVHHVGRLSAVPKVYNSVVLFVAVFMVDVVFRNFTVMKQPAYSMRQIGFFKYLDPDVSIFMNRSSNRTCAFAASASFIS